MQMIDFNQFKQNQRMYGGTAGRKMGIIYEGKNYILKFPGNLKEQQMVADRHSADGKERRCR